MKLVFEPGAATAAPGDLVEKIYASALDPGHYDELMGLWQSHLETVMADLSEDEEASPDAFLPPLHALELERHFLRAFSILERLGRVEDDTRSIEALVEVNTQPSMLIDVEGRLTAVNAAAATRLGVSIGDRLDSIHLDVDGLASLRTALAGMHGQAVSRLLAIGRACDVEGNTMVLALTRAQRPDGAPPIGVLTVADLGWSMRMGELLKTAFGLTDTECDIARALVAGETPRAIAEARNRALLTVRTQTKSVLRKVDVRSQSDLIRLMAALVRMDLTGQHPDKLALAGFTRSIIRPGNRRLDYVCVGPETGRPVLFIHGMLDGQGVTRACEDQLHARNIRLVAPTRPHFGDSAPDMDEGDAALRLARDVEAVIDELGIGRCPVIGHMAGAIYAFACAQVLGERISAIVNVAGGVPIVSHQQFAVMTPRQRIVAYTARYTPTLLPLILRAGIALLDSGGDQAFMRALYETAPVDHAVARRPEVFAILSQGYRFTTRQGHGAFEIDSRQVTANWSALLEGSNQPVTLVHGAHDPVVRIGTVREFAGRVGARVNLVEVPEGGQLLFYAHPDLVLDAVEQSLAAVHVNARQETP